MESKYIRVRPSKVDDAVEFYGLFGWELVGDKEFLKNGKIGLTFEREKRELDPKVLQYEKMYEQVSKPFPIGAIIAFGLGSILLALYFVMMKIFEFYIIFLYVSLSFYGLFIYLMLVFLILFIKRGKIQDKILDKLDEEFLDEEEEPEPKKEKKKEKPAKEEKKKAETEEPIAEAAKEETPAPKEEVPPEPVPEKPAPAKEETPKAEEPAPETKE